MPKLDRDTAMTCHYVHHASQCALPSFIGPRGALHHPKRRMWRRNGRTQVWKTRPSDFRLPIKFGFHSYESLTQDELGWHTGTPEECELGWLRKHLQVSEDY